MNGHAWLCPCGARNGPAQASCWQCGSPGSLGRRVPAVAAPPRPGEFILPGSPAEPSGFLLPDAEDYAFPLAQPRELVVLTAPFGLVVPGIVLGSNWDRLGRKEQLAATLGVCSGTAMLLTTLYAWCQTRYLDGVTPVVAWMLFRVPSVVVAGLLAAEQLRAVRAAGQESLWRRAGWVDGSVIALGLLSMAVELVVSGLLVFLLRP
jgi:hypothetical protein